MRWECDTNVNKGGEESMKILLLPWWHFGVDLDSITFYWFSGSLKADFWRRFTWYESHYEFVLTANKFLMNLDSTCCLNSRATGNKIMKTFDLFEFLNQRIPVFIVLFWYSKRHFFLLEPGQVRTNPKKYLSFVQSLHLNLNLEHSMFNISPHATTYFHDSWKFWQNTLLFFSLLDISLSVIPTKNHVY